MTDTEIIQLKDLLRSAVSAAYAEADLMDKSDGESRKGNEQTIVFRVGLHLHELLKQTKYCCLNLDCEYNKHGDDPKRIDEEVIRPDLLIHSRGNDDQNILVVEFAGWWKSEQDLTKDKKKLEALTNAQGNYKYRLGVLVKIQKEEPTYIYYPN